MSSHKRFTCSCSGGAEKEVAPFIRMEGGTRVCGRVAGISFPASLP